MQAISVAWLVLLAATYPSDGGWWGEPTVVNATEAPINGPRHGSHTRDLRLEDLQKKRPTGQMGSDSS